MKIKEKMDLFLNSLLLNKEQEGLKETEVNIFNKSLKIL
jgi:hypothetical protein